MGNKCPTCPSCGDKVDRIKYDSLQRDVDGAGCRAYQQMMLFDQCLMENPSFQPKPIEIPDHCRPYI